VFLLSVALPLPNCSNKNSRSRNETIRKALPGTLLIMLGQKMKRRSVMPQLIIMAGQIDRCDIAVQPRELFYFFRAQAFADRGQRRLGYIEDGD